VTEARQVVIIGSGPAGLTAAIYASRAQLSPLVIEGEPSSTSDQPGGQLMLTTDVENFPGFVDGVMGPELMSNFREQAARFGTEYMTAKVSRVDLASRPFGLWVGDPEAAEPTFPTKSVCSDTACPPAPPATDFSSGARRSPWLAGATLPSRKHYSSRSSPTR
jgi:thioredoxin reductase (NADPH)